MKKPPSPIQKRVLALVRRAGVMRPRDLEAKGISATHLRRLTEKGLVIRLRRGLYMAADAELSENHTLAEVASIIPSGVVCLLSALRFHQLGTQNPSRIWVAIDVKARKPNHALVEVVRFSGAALREGIEHHRVGGVDVPIYSASKTVTDCFKYRNKIGVDVAVEALRAFLGGRSRSLDELMRYARVCRVSKVMAPYVEAMIS